MKILFRVLLCLQWLFIKIIEQLLKRESIDKSHFILCFAQQLDSSSISIMAFTQILIWIVEDFVPPFASSQRFIFSVLLSSLFVNMVSCAVESLPQLVCVSLSY
jgi:hypothetical protein